MTEKIAFDFVESLLFWFRGENQQATIEMANKRTDNTQKTDEYLVTK